MDSILLQKKIKDNAEDLRSYVSDMEMWLKDMKRKEKAQPHNLSQTSSGKRAKHNTSDKSRRKPRISSYDYSAWDRFDVDKACKEMDSDSPNGESTDGGNDSSDISEMPDIHKAKEDYRTLEALRDEAMYEKELGNDHVKKGNWKAALPCYSRAIQCYAYDAIFYANRALCYLKLKDLRAAEADSTSAIQLDPTYVKAYQRRAAARMGLDQYKDAKEDLLNVLQLEPHNTAAKNELKKIDYKLHPELKKSKTADEISLVTKSESDPNLTKQNPSVITEPVSHMDSVVEEPSSDSQRVLNTLSDMKLVETMHKPPHLRSKKPLHRVVIEEVWSCLSNESKKMDLSSGDSTSTLTKNSECNNKMIEPQQYKQGISDVLHELPPVPKSSVQFVTTWKKVKNNPSMRFLFLKQICGEELPEIFQNSLESGVFSELLSALTMDFMGAKEPVYHYLVGLSSVQRFRALTMFMTSSDKAGIRTLLNYCERTGECSKEDVMLLAKKYELD